MYVLTSLEDDIVPAWMALKYTAKLRHLERSAGRSGQLIACRVHYKGGHFGGGIQNKDNQV